MLKAKRYLYVVFMCQQSIEKLIKAVILKDTKETPPYSHRLLMLMKMTKLETSQEQLDFLELLTQYYIAARYPEYKQSLARKLDQKKCRDFYKKTRETFEWLKNESKIRESY